MLFANQTDNAWKGGEEGEDERQSDRVMNPRGDAARVSRRPPKFFKRTFAVSSTTVIFLDFIKLHS